MTYFVIKYVLNMIHNCISDCQAKLYEIKGIGKFFYEFYEYASDQIYIPTKLLIFKCINIPSN